MGMTIDDAKEWLVSRKEHYELDDNCQELAQALDIALATMRKYQKIEELMRGWNNFNSYERMCDIYEVIEDGNDD